MTDKTSTGLKSTGVFSTGHCSTGSHSTGYRSTGDCSTGDLSTGYCSTGAGSTGDWSISNRSTGHFSTEHGAGFGAFNKPCESHEWEGATKPAFLYRIRVTEWVCRKDMTPEEESEYPSSEKNGGYLKTIPMKEAWAKAWAERKKGEEEMLRALPNFDAEVFKEISGIDVDAKVCPTCGQEKSNA